MTISRKFDYQHAVCDLAERGSYFFKYEGEVYELKRYRRRVWLVNGNMSVPHGEMTNIFGKLKVSLKNLRLDAQKARKELSGEKREQRRLGLLKLFYNYGISFSGSPEECVQTLERIDLEKLEDTVNDNPSLRELYKHFGGNLKATLKTDRGYFIKEFSKNVSLHIILQPN